MQRRAGQGQGQAMLGFRLPSWRSSCSWLSQPCLEPWYGDDTIKGLGNGATATGEGSVGKKTISKEGNILSVSFFSNLFCPKARSLLGF